MIVRLFVVLLVLSAFSAPAGADESEVLGVFQDWIAYKTTQGGNAVCYIASEPTKAEGKYTKRGKIYAMVTHRPKAGSFDVVSLHAGYTYKKGSTAEAAIGGRAFTLFTNESAAWAAESADDAALVKAMRAGSKLVVKGVSSRGTKTKDTYSLLGFTAAHKAISKACKKS